MSESSTPAAPFEDWPKSQREPMHSLTSEQVMALALEVSQAVSAELELDALCERIVKRIAELIQADISALLFVEEERQVLTVRRAVGMSQEAVESFLAPVTEGLFGEVMVARKPLLTLKPSQRVRAEAARHRDGGPFGPRPGPVLVAPLVADRRVKGMIVLARAEGHPPFVQGEHLLVELLCAGIAQSIDNAWLYGQLRALNRDLEDKVAERTRQLDIKAQILERALRDLREMQVQFVQREKMASLGQLTAGLAHEINNPLAYATSNVALARERVQRVGLCLELERARSALQHDRSPDHAWLVFAPLLERLRNTRGLEADVSDFAEEAATLPDPQRVALADQFLCFLLDRLRPSEALAHDLTGYVETQLDRAAQGLSRVKQIVLDLRSFSRLDEAECQWADLDAGIDTTLDLLRHLAKETGVNIEFHRGMLQPYPCRPSWMNQVVMNLVVNAIHASALGQTVEVRTTDRPSGVTIEVQDHGHGIPPENLHRIFDPFFTTKPVGEGMGLGLSLCYRIVSDHGGRIDVASEPGVQTTFRVELPPRPTPTTQPSCNG